MDIEEILKFLDCSPIIDRKITGKTRKYADAALILHPMSPIAYEVDIAYFIHASRFNLIKEQHLSDLTFFVYLDEPLKSVEPGPTIVTFKDEEAFLEAFRLISHEFQTLARKKSTLIDIMRDINEGVSLTSLVNKLSELFEAPSTVLDAALNYISVSDDLPDYVAGGDVQARLPTDAVELMARLKLVHPDRATEVSLFSYRLPKITDALIYNHIAFIRSRNTLIGSVSLFTLHEPLRQSYIDMLPAVAQLLSVALRRDNANITSQSYVYSRIFDQFESYGATNYRPRLERQLKAIGYDLRHYLGTIVIDFKEEGLTPSQALELALNTHTLIPNSIYSIQRGEIIFFNSTDTHSSSANVNVEALRKAFDSTHTYVGFGNVFIDSRHIPEAISQARRAIKAGRMFRPELNVYLFEDLSVFDLLLNVSSSELLYSYRYPPLLKLMDHDYAHNGKLSYTLYEYLKNPTRPTEVATCLNIHKNTLYYRLEKTRQIMGVDISNGDVIAKIQITFYVLKVQNRFEMYVERTRETDVAEGARTLFEVSLPSGTSSRHDER